MARRKVVEEQLDDDETASEQIVIDEVITDNARDVPMFADIDGRTSRSISQLRLYKLEQGGPAYKGMIPLNSTLETIGQVYGDGIYTIEGLNNKHTVLATKDNIRISLSTAAQQALSDGPRTALSTGDNAEGDRIERLALKSAAEAQELSRNYTTLTVETFRAAAERDRESHAASREAMGSIFANLMTIQQAGFQQILTLMQSSHNHTLETLSAANQSKQRQQNDGAQLVETLLRGLEMGRELGGGTEQPAWQQILQGGLGILGSANQPKGATAAVLPNPEQPAQGGMQLTKRARREIREALQLVREIRSKGIAPRELLAQLSRLDADNDDDDELEDEPDNVLAESDGTAETEEAKEPSH